MSELRSNRIVPKNGLVSGANSAGGIIQIQQGTLTAPASTSTSGSFTDTGLTCAITPTSTSLWPSGGLTILSFQVNV